MDRLGYALSNKKQLRFPEVPLTGNLVTDVRLTSDIFPSYSPIFVVDSRFLFYVAERNDLYPINRLKHKKAKLPSPIRKVAKSSKNDCSENHGDRNDSCRREPCACKYYLFGRSVAVLWSWSLTLFHTCPAFPVISAWRSVSRRPFAICPNDFSDSNYLFCGSYKF